MKLAAFVRNIFYHLVEIRSYVIKEIIVSVNQPYHISCAVNQTFKSQKKPHFLPFLSVADIYFYMKPKQVVFQRFDTEKTSILYLLDQPIVLNNKMFSILTYVNEISFREIGISW